MVSYFQKTDTKLLINKIAKLYGKRQPLHWNGLNARMWFSPSAFFYVHLLYFDCIEFEKDFRSVVISLFIFYFFFLFDDGWRVVCHHIIVVIHCLNFAVIFYSWIYIQSFWIVQFIFIVLRLLLYGDTVLCITIIYPDFRA